MGRSVLTETTSKSTVPLTSQKFRNYQLNPIFFSATILISEILNSPFTHQSPENPQSHNHHRVLPLSSTMVADVVITWSKMNNLHLNLVDSSKIINLTASFIYDHEKPWWKQILDPNGDFVNKWNRVFLVTSLMALFLDPLFFYIPRMQEKCIDINTTLAVIIIIMRSIVDFFSFLHITMKFRTAYVEPCSRVFGKGDLVCDPKKIAYRYLRSELVVDALAALPIPQVGTLFFIPQSFQIICCN